MAEEKAIDSDTRQVVKTTPREESLPESDEEREIEEERKIIAGINADMRASIDTWPEYKQAVFEKVKEAGAIDPDEAIFFERDGIRYGFKRSFVNPSNRTEFDELEFYRINPDVPRLEEDKERFLAGHRYYGRDIGVDFDKYFDTVLDTSTEGPDLNFRSPDFSGPTSFELDEEGSEVRAAREFVDALLLISPKAAPRGKLVKATVVIPPKALPQRT